MNPKAKGRVGRTEKTAAIQRVAVFHYRKEVFYFCSFFLAAATVASYMIGVPIMMEA